MFRHLGENLLPPLHFEFLDDQGFNEYIIGGGGRFEKIISEQSCVSFNVLKLKYIAVTPLLTFAWLGLLCVTVQWPCILL